jgi:HAD superfamily hydrolase (TIGR01458 family)
VDPAQHDGVVLGLSPEHLSYAWLDKAFLVLREGGRPLIATHKGRYFFSEAGQLAMGPGGFVRALEFATGLESQVVGKPSEAFFRVVLASLGDELPGLRPDEVAMVGDDVLDDCAAARQLGLLSVLVRTGKYSAGDEARHPGACDLVVDDVSALAALVEAAPRPQPPPIMPKL